MSGYPSPLPSQDLRLRLRPAVQNPAFHWTVESQTYVKVVDSLKTQDFSLPETAQTVSTTFSCSVSTHTYLQMLAMGFSLPVTQKFLRPKSGLRLLIQSTHKTLEDMHFSVEKRIQLYSERLQNTQGR